MSARARRWLVTGCVILCAAGAALNLAAMIAGYSSRWTVIAFCVELTGLWASLATFRSTGGQR